MCGAKVGSGGRGVRSREEESSAASRARAGQQHASEHPAAPLAFSGRCGPQKELRRGAAGAQLASEFSPGRAPCHASGVAVVTLRGPLLFGPAVLPRFCVPSTHEHSQREQAQSSRHSSGPRRDSKQRHPRLSDRASTRLQAWRAAPGTCHMHELYSCTTRRRSGAARDGGCRPEQLSLTCGPGWPARQRRRRRRRGARATARAPTLAARCCAGGASRATLGEEEEEEASSPPTRSRQTMRDPATRRRAWRSARAAGTRSSSGR